MLSVLRIERQRFAFEIFVGVNGMEFCFINPSERSFRRSVAGYPIDFIRALKAVAQSGIDDVWGYTIKGVGHGTCYSHQDDTHQVCEQLVFADRLSVTEATELGEEGFSLKMRPEERLKITQTLDDYWLV